MVMGPGRGLPRPASGRVDRWHLGEQGVPDEPGEPDEPDDPSLGHPTLRWRTE